MHTANSCNMQSTLASCIITRDCNSFCAISANTTADARAQEATLTARVTMRVKIICGDGLSEEDYDTEAPLIRVAIMKREREIKLMPIMMMDIAKGKTIMAPARGKDPRK